MMPLRNAIMFGTLYALVTVGLSGFMLLDKLPDALGWIKLAGLFVGNMAMGAFAYMRDPEQAWKIGPSGVKTGVGLVLCLALAGCSGLGILQNPATETAQQRAIMESTNARGCIYFRGNAKPWADVTALIVGTWGADPPTYVECWQGLPAGMP